MSYDENCAEARENSNVVFGKESNFAFSRQINVFKALKGADTISFWRIFLQIQNLQIQSSVFFIDRSYTKKR